MSGLSTSEDKPMLFHDQVNSRVLFRLLRTGKVRFAGNRRLGIYGRLDCRSGKRMNKNNRVFFINEEIARAEGYRPCGHCMKEAYKIWKNGIV